MGPGFKYHVVTIAAIFFALTVGLVVGSLVGSPRVGRTEERMLRALKVSLDKDLVDKSQEIDHYKRCLGLVLPRVVAGTLSGRKVAIVQTGAYPEVVDGVKHVLELAGATVTSVTTIDRVMARPDTLLNSMLAARHDVDPRIPTDRNGVALGIARVLANGEVNSGANSNLLMPTLESSGLIRTESTSKFQYGVGYVVIIGGNRPADSNRPENVDRPLVSALQDQKLVVVMCEPEHAEVSDVAAYHALNLDVATVDDIDSDIGLCELVFSLIGEKDDYGVKSTAKNLLPGLAFGSN